MSGNHIYVLDIRINIVFKIVAAGIGICISTFCDWPVFAPVFTMLFVWGRNSAFRTKIATILCLLFFAGSTFFDGYGAAPLSRVIPISLLSILGMGIAGICLIYFYNGERGSRNAIFSKWLFYFFYPAHLLILGLLRLAFLVW